LERIKRSEFLTTTLMLVAVVVGVVGLQVALKLALRTGYPLAVVESGSMRPTLEVGDLIVVQGVNPSEIQAGPPPEGDIIVFYRHPGATRRIFLFFRSPVLIVHRAVDRTENGDIVTQGDNNTGRDPPVPEEWVVGRVMYRVPWVGHISLFIQTDTGTVTIITLMIALLLIGYLPFPASEGSEKEAGQGPKSAESRIED